MPTSDNPDVVVEVRRSLHCPVRHCPHHGPRPLFPPLLHCPIATPGSPRGNNQCSTAESNQAAHAVTGIRTHHPLIRGNLCLHTATTSWATESLQPTYPCSDGDLNPRTSHQRELIGACLSMYNHGYTWMCTYTGHSIGLKDKGISSFSIGPVTIIHAVPTGCLMNFATFFYLVSIGL